MPEPRNESSRQRFERYLQRDDAKRAEPKAPPSDAAGAAGDRGFGWLLASYIKLISGHRRSLVGAGVALVGAAGLGLLPPVGTKIALDYLLTDSPGPTGLPFALGERFSVPSLLLLLGATLLTIILVERLVELWGRWQIHRLQRRLELELRHKAFAKALRLPLDRAQQLRSGGLSSAVRADPTGASELVSSMLYSPVRGAVQLVGTMAVLGSVDAGLVVLTLALLPVIWLTHRSWIGKIRPLWRDIRRTRDEINAHATEAFGGLRVVRVFGQERAESRRDAVVDNLRARQSIYAWWRARTIGLVWGMIGPVATTVVLVYGGGRVLEGHITIGDMMMFSTYILMLISPLQSLVGSATSLQTNLAALERLLDMLAEPEELEDARGSTPLFAGDVKGRIELDGVRYRYPDRDAWVLDDVSLTVEPGEMVALVGKSGAGKTTLCNLVARFFDPVSGSVRLDGTDIRELRLEDYRALIGVVEQDVFLFDGTLRDNIAFARPDATDDDVRAALARAAADDFVADLDDGLDTIIGERGVKLSGGQRQRLAIARALLADPRVLILDEATSNLDAESEARIKKSLGELMAGRTSFVIAHRLSTIRHADRICVLEGGHVVETGTHEELLAASGRYADLLKAQLEVDDEESPGDTSSARPPIRAVT